MGEFITSIYVASSWRNGMQPAVVETLRAAGKKVYDFRNPPNRSGFGWEQVMSGFEYENQLCEEKEYLSALAHPIAEAGFNADFHAMRICDACILVLPCGRSAHLELGWFVGKGKPTAILLDGPMVTPELMYKMVDHIAPNMLSLLEWVGVSDI